MSLKLGQKVRVKKDLKVNGVYNNHFFFEEMRKFKGEIVTIKKITIRGNLFLIEEDEMGIVWTKDMFEAEVQQVIE